MALRTARRHGGNASRASCRRRRRETALSGDVSLTEPFPRETNAVEAESCSLPESPPLGPDGKFRVFFELLIPQGLVSFFLGLGKAQRAATLAYLSPCGALGCAARGLRVSVFGRELCNVRTGQAARRDRGETSLRERLRATVSRLAPASAAAR
ncbi:hypothetical protein SKAU_G00306530 [Synaphobranchus kaupii]|uniref:Uncharacterized protein n=1 Tax=Synaphobranchus kaupii TaxID=118154 RepID=A0A9Q1EQQ1_SYNKA|nr:hypothetical protein SKAU_G00306530 [Synaphobranchus kaupii]